MRMCVEFVERRDAVVDGEDASSALLVPPLVASPDLLLEGVVVALHVLLEHERLSEVQQLSLAAGRLRVARLAFVVV